MLRRDGVQTHNLMQDWEICPDLLTFGICVNDDSDYITKSELRCKTDRVIIMVLANIH